MVPDAEFWEDEHTREKHMNYKDNWKQHLPKEVDVVFIDAGHQYHQVKMDIENSLNCFNNPIFIFDDYGYINPGSGVGEVKQAIDEKINAGKLKLHKYIGEKSEDLISANSAAKFFDMEGCICNFK